MDAGRSREHSTSSREDSPDYEPMHNPYRRMRSYEVVYDKQLPNSTLAIQLSELAANYAQNVPFRVQVTTSSMAAASYAAANKTRPSIKVDEIYTIHLVREMKILVAQCTSGEQLEFPIHSSAKIGLVPEDEVRKYRTVEDILNAKQLPKVLAVRYQYVSVDSNISLRKSEVLLVKEVVRGKFGRTKTALRVFSLLSHLEVVLPKDCDAEFITNPECTQVYLTDLLDNDIAFLPCKAYLYPGRGSALSGSLPITITTPQTRKSMIISLYQDSPNAKPQDTVFIDIPATTDASVAIIKTDQSDRIYDRIYEQSQYLLTTCSLSQIQYCVGGPAIQASLLAEVREGKATRELASSAPKQYHDFLTSKSWSSSSSSNPGLLSPVVSSHTVGPPGPSPGHRTPLAAPSSRNSTESNVPPPVPNRSPNCDTEPSILPAVTSGAEPSMPPAVPSRSPNPDPEPNVPPAVPSRGTAPNASPMAPNRSPNRDAEPLAVPCCGGVEPSTLSTLQGSSPNYDASRDAEPSTFPAVPSRGNEFSTTPAVSNSDGCGLPLAVANHNSTPPEIPSTGAKLPAAPTSSSGTITTHGNAEPPPQVSQHACTPSQK